jgi:hypothetical protein
LQFSGDYSEVGIRDAEPEDGSTNQDFRPFGSGEDAAILMWVERIGNRWKRISGILAHQFGLRWLSLMKML